MRETLASGTEEASAPPVSVREAVWHSIGAGPGLGALRGKEGNQDGQESQGPGRRGHVGHKASLRHSFSSERKWPLWGPSHQAQCLAPVSLVRTITAHLRRPRILVSRTWLLISLQSLIEASFVNTICSMLLVIFLINPLK